MKGYHGAQLLGATAYETPFGPVLAHQVHVQTPLAALQLQPRAKRAADLVPEAVRALGRVELHTEWGNLFLKKLSQGAGAIELMVDILPAGVPRIARSLQARERPATGVRTSSFQASCEAGGSRAAAPRNGGTTKEPSLCLHDPGIIPQEELAAEADVFPLRACCS